jgi:uncharacterized protein (TIGR03435 family)
LTVLLGNALLLLISAALSIAAAQTVTPLSFEVASVKLNRVNPNRRPSFPQFLPGGRFSARGVPLRFIIATAWNVGLKSVRLSGGPGWINSFESFYDIEAKAPQGVIPAGLASNVRDQRMRLMLQSLLEDRFKLNIQTETRELPVYVVAAAKGGLKLQESDVQEKDCPQATEVGVACHTISGGQGRGLHGRAVSISDILTFVESWTDRPLVDRTGIQGLFKVETKGWRDLQPEQEPPPGAKTEDGSDAADVPTLFTVFERLGLKLQTEKGTVQVFVIDRVERPSEN